jgi:LmbE family N-acetylglucosaminyl deacetylase
VTIVNLVVVAHPDDEILGFGAAGAKLVEDGEIVQPVLLCANVDARNQRPRDSELAADIEAANETAGFRAPILGDFPNIRMNTVPHIEIVQFIEAQIEQFTPTRVFTHHPADLNDDHRQVSRACLAASRLAQRRKQQEVVKSLHLMEILSATDWVLDASARRFEPNLFVEVGKHVDTKLRALACYRNVMRNYPHPRSEEAIRGLAAIRGAQSGQQFAEAFQTVFQRDF